MILFKFLAFIFIVGLVAVIVTVIGFGVRVRSMIDQLRGGGANRGTTHTTTRNNDGVIDQRDPEVSERKIFSKDEGEYVDYTVEDDNNGESN